MRQRVFQLWVWVPTLILTFFCRWPEMSHYVVCVAKLLSFSSLSLFSVFRVMWISVFLRPYIQHVPFLTQTNWTIYIRFPRQIIASILSLSSHHWIKITTVITHSCIKRANMFFFTHYLFSLPRILIMYTVYNYIYT